MKLFIQIRSNLAESVLELFQVMYTKFKDCSLTVSDFPDCRPAMARIINKTNSAAALTCEFIGQTPGGQSQCSTTAWLKIC